MPENGLVYGFIKKKSINFVNPDSDAYTQNIEEVWRDAREDIS